jgi:hypothetical protein
MSARFIDGVVPDALLALQLGTNSAVLALEVDEGTEHAPVIRAKLSRYREALEGRSEWHVVFVVGEPERARWIRDVARRSEGLAVLGGNSWATSIYDVRRGALAAPVASLIGGKPAHLDEICTPATERHIAHAVGSDRWIRLMGSGAGEDVRDAFT